MPRTPYKSALFISTDISFLETQKLGVLEQQEVVRTLHIRRVPKDVT
jgi:hypothetical protein